MQSDKHALTKLRIELIQKDISTFKQIYETCLEDKSRIRTYFNDKITLIDRQVQKISKLMLLDNVDLLITLFVDLKIYFVELISEIENSKGCFADVEHSDKRLFLQSITKLEQDCRLIQVLPGEKRPNEKEFLQALAVRKQQLKLEQSNAFKSILENVNQLRSKANSKVSCFISYAWPSEDRSYEYWTQEFIKTFCSHLQLAGIITYLDLENSRYGYNSYEHMNKIDDSHFIIVFGTESLADKHNLGISSVCVELNRIRQKRLQDSRVHIYTVIPIILSGNMDTSLPGEYVRYTVVESFVGKNYVETIKGILARLYQLGNQHIPYLDIWQNAKITLGDNYSLPPENEVVEFWKQLQIEMSKQKYTLPVTLPIAPPTIPTSTLVLPVTLQKTYSPIINLPFCKNPHFAGRVAQIKQLKELISLKTNNTIVRSICGIAGIGKTQLVVEWAYQIINDKECELVWYVSQNNIEKDILSLADALGVDKNEKSDSRIILTIQKLNKMKKWILIIDEVDKYDVVKKYFPNCGGIILILSQDRQIISSEPIVIEPYDRKESIEYTTRFLGNTATNIPQDVDNLAMLYGDSPLGLALACAFIHDKRISIEKYIQYFKERRTQLWSKDKPPQDYKANIIVAWSMTFEKIKQESQQAADLLNYIAFLSPTRIPLKLLMQFIPNQDDFDFDDAKSTLFKYLIINMYESGEYFSIHTILQLVIREQLYKDKREINYINAVIKAIINIYPDLNYALDFFEGVIHEKLMEKYQGIIINLGELNSHLGVLIELANQNYDLYKKLPYLYYLLGISHLLMGNSVEAVINLEIALRMKNTILSGKAPDLEIACINRALAHAYGDLANDNQAILYLEKALEISQKLLGSDNQMVLNILFELGMNLPMIGVSQAKKGLFYLKQALPIAKKIYGEKSFGVVILLRHIEEIHRKLGNMPLSCFYGRQRVEVLKVLAGKTENVQRSETILPINVDKAKTRIGLKNEHIIKNIFPTEIVSSFALGKAIDNGDCFFDALAQILNKINNTDVNTDKYLRMLCHDFYLINKELVDAWNKVDYGRINKGREDYFFIQYTAEDCRNLFNGRSPIWGRPLIEGRILCHQLKLETICIIEILEDPESKSSVPSYHLVNKESYRSITVNELQMLLQNPKIPCLIVDQNSLHFVPLLKNNSIVNKSLSVQSKEGPLNTHGQKSDLMTQHPLKPIWIGNNLSNQIIQIEERLKIIEQIHGRNHRLTAMLLIGLARLKSKAKNYGEALRHFNDAKQIVQTLCGKEDRRYTSVLWEIAIMYANQNEYELASKIYQELLELTIKIENVNHPLIGDINFEIGKLYFEMDKYKDAIPTLNKALEIYRSSLGSEHQFVAEVLSYLGDCQYNLKSNKQALSSYQQAVVLIEKLYKLHYPFALYLNQCIGDCYDNLNHYQQALEHYLKVVQNHRNPDDIEDGDELYLNIATLYWKLCQQEEALKYYITGIEVNPKNVRLHQDAACCYHGLALSQNRPEFLKKAEEYFTKAIAIDADASVLADYANFLYQQNRVDESIQLLKRVINESNDDVNTITYSIHDQITLPEELKSDVDWSEETVEFFAVCYAYYLIILVYVKNNQYEDASSFLSNFEDHMIGNKDRNDRALYRASCALIRSKPKHSDKNDVEEDLLQQAILLSLTDVSGSSVSSAPPHSVLFSPSATIVSTNTVSLSTTTVPKNNPLPPPHPKSI